MNASETIEAAIDKLTKLRDTSNPGPWTPITPIEHRDGAWARFVLGKTVSLDVDFKDSRDVADAQLISTLHATIDAQLLIMRNELEEIAIDKEASGFERPPHHDVFTLARAIVGDEVAR